MPKKDENLDPVVVAALVEDSGEDDKDKEARKKALKDAEETDDPEAQVEQDDDEDEESDDKSSQKKPKEKSEDDESDDKEGDDPKDPKQKSKVKSDDDELTDEEKEEQERQSRKERREERRKKWQESLRKPKPAAQPLLQADPSYKPLDYDAAEEFKADELKKDRELAMQNALAQGAQIERHIQEQERFWDRTDMEDQILRYNPELQFLNPDNEEAYNPKRADAVLQSFLQAVGYKEEPLYDPNTRQPLIDPETGKQKVRPTVQRTDISWREYAEGYVANMEEWLDEEMSERSSEIVAQQSRQGIRPGGSSRKGKPQLRPGMFREMSDEEFERMDEETDEAILSAF